MKIRITKNHVDALCVLIGVLGMGSLYFQVLRMPLMAAMLIASILLLTRAHHPKISAQNIRLTLLLTAALMAQVYTNDIFTAYVFLEIMTLAACALIAIRKRGRTLVAATRYMIMNLIGSGLFLLGIILSLIHI